MSQLPDPFEDAKKAATPEFQSAIGVLFIIAGAAETALAFEIMRMMAHPNKFSASALPLVSGMDLKVKLNIIRTYARMHNTSPDEISALEPSEQSKPCGTAAPHVTSQSIHRSLDLL